jgi:hypothetical protein
MSYQHTSGATKRKKKREEMLSLRKLQKIDHFCNPAPKQSQSASAELKNRRSQDGCNVAGRTPDTSCVNEGNVETQRSISLATSLPDVCTAYLLFLTLPVTVATAERSFSKLKLIKNYLRSTMLQDRLSGLAILSIENEKAKKMDVDELVNIFAEKKCRRKKF